MSIERAIVGFYASVAAALAAGNAGSDVPKEWSSSPETLFTRLVAACGVEQLKAQTDQIAQYLMGTLKSGVVKFTGLAPSIEQVGRAALAHPPDHAEYARLAAMPTGTGARLTTSSRRIAALIYEEAARCDPSSVADLDPAWVQGLLAEAIGCLLSDNGPMAELSRIQSQCLEIERAQGGIDIDRVVSTSAPADAPARPLDSHAAQLSPPPPAMTVEKSGKAEYFPKPERPREARLEVFRKCIIALVQKAPSGQIGDVAMSRIEESLTALSTGDVRDGARYLQEGANSLNTQTGGGSSALRLTVAELYEVAARLQEESGDFAAAARDLFCAFQAVPETETSLRWSYALRQGALQMAASDGQSNSASLEEAVRVYARALQLQPVEAAPELWSVAQNCLGNALSALGQRNQDADMLALAAKSYRTAARLVRRDAAPREWALVQNNLGSVLLKTGEIRNSEENYESAAEAFDLALEALRPDVSPADWAAAEAGRGMARGRLATLRNDLELLERTARSVDRAILMTPRGAATAQWARLQSCLGNLSADIGERVSGRHWLERAVAAYEAAQLEWTIERSPLQWALSEANRGNALWSLADLSSSRVLRAEAGRCLARAHAAFRRLGEEAYAKATQESLDRLEKGERTGQAEGRPAGARAIAGL
jgi:tetratricopeptide (TPR) repeat protein